MKPHSKPCRRPNTISWSTAFDHGFQSGDNDRRWTLTYDSSTQNSSASTPYRLDPRVENLSNWWMHFSLKAMSTKLLTYSGINLFNSAALRKGQDSRGLRLIGPVIRCETLTLQILDNGLVIVKKNRND